MILSLNIRSNGFFRVFDKQRNKSYAFKTVSCSQPLRLTWSTEGMKVKEGTITFYYPTDWLMSKGRNPQFFKFWLGLAKKFFHEVRHTRSGLTTAEMGVTLHNFIKDRGGIIHQTDEYNQVDTGNVVTNDSWEEFEMTIEDGSLETEKRQYWAYCMIRYLFSDYYDLIVNTFTRLYKMFKIQAQDISDFEVFQLSHYYFPGYQGYNTTYSVLASGTLDTCIYKVMTLDEFNKAITKDWTGKNICDVFRVKGLSGLKILDFQKLLDQGTYKKIYEQIK